MLRLRPQRPGNFRVVQFNVLGGSLGLPKYFPFALPANLDWAVRRERVVSEALADAPHIVCMEEVDDYWTFFKPYMAARGFDSVYAKRSSLFVSPTSWCGSYRHDGSAVFWRAPFRLLDARTLFFSDEEDRVAQLVLLSDGPAEALPVPAHTFSARGRAAAGAESPPARCLLVVCTHLHWNAASPNQERELAELRAQAAAWRAEVTAAHGLPVPPPVVLCGDLNASPGSAVLRAAASRWAEPATDVRLVSAYDEYGTALDKAGRPRVGDAEVQGATAQGGPVCTTLTHRRLSAIDYVMHDEDRLAVAALRPLPSLHRLTAQAGAPGWAGGLRGDALAKSAETLARLRVMKHAENAGSAQAGLPVDSVGAGPVGAAANREEMERELRGIPNVEFGSDHLAIAAEFEWI